MTQPIEYDLHGRMKYHPDYHANHKKPWMVSEEKYLIENYISLGPDVVAAALERTIGVVMTRAYELRKAGKMPRRALGTKTHKRARSL